MTTILGHFNRAHSAGTWITGFSPPPNDWPGFDARSAQAINGDDGGTWAPAIGHPIIISAGFGMIVEGPSVIVGDGAYLKSLTAGAFQLSSTEWPVLGATHTSRSRNIVSTCLRAAVNASQAGPSVAMPAVPNLAYASPQTVLTPGQVLQLSVPLRCHDGATLTSVTVNWIVAWPHTATTLPKFRVLRIDQYGASTTMSSTAAGADASGYFTPGTSGWSHPGVAQSFVVTVDTNNVVDISSFEYVLEVDEEQGVTGFPWSAQCFQQACSFVDTSGLITPSGVAQTIDGITVSTPGTYVLLTTQSDATQNGLWQVQTGSWVRYALPFSHGAIFWVQQGNQLAQTYWQMPAIQGAAAPPPLWKKSTVYGKGAVVAPVTGGLGLVAICTTNGTSDTSEPSWPSIAGQTVSDNGTIWTMQLNTFVGPQISPLPDPERLVTGAGAGFAVFGNIWLPVECSFDGIVDCRWD